MAGGNTIDLFAHWPAKDLGAAFLTTFTFNPPFFELHLLPELLRRGAHPVVVLVDRDEGYEAATTCAATLGAAGRDYHLVAVQRIGGVFHPKVHLFTGEREHAMRPWQGALLRSLPPYIYWGETSLGSARFRGERRSFFGVGFSAPRAPRGARRASAPRRGDTFAAGTPIAMPHFDCEPQQNPRGLVQLLTRAGYQARLSGVRRVHVATAANPPACFAFSGWATRAQATHRAVVAAILASPPPPTPEPVIDARDVAQSGPARQTLRATSSLDFFQECERLILSGANQAVADIVDLIVLPEFFRKFPGGRAGFVAPNAAWGDRAGALRGLAATDFMSWAWARRAGGIFPMLRSYHGGPTVSFDKWLGAYTAIALPSAECVGVARNPGHLIFVLDVPVNPIGRPASDWEVIADPFSLIATSQRGGGRRSLVRTPLGVPAASALVDDALADINAAFAFLTAPENYETASGRCDFAAMALGLVQFDRITAEVGIAATSPHHFLRKLFGFAVVDKLAATGFKRASEIKKHKLRGLPVQTRNRRLGKFTRGLEPELFSGLFSDPQIVGPFSAALAAARNPAVVALAATLPTLQQQLAASVLAGVYIPQARANARVSMRYRDRAGGKPLRTRTMSEAEYVSDFLRQMRNTHHGYGLHQQKFERLLCCHTGEFGDQGADLALLFWLAAVQRPDFVTHGRWVEGLTLRRTHLTP